MHNKTIKKISTIIVLLFTTVYFNPLVIPNALATPTDPATCGDNVVGAGEGCEPPSTTACDVSCQVIPSSCACGTSTSSSGTVVTTDSATGVCGNGVVEASNNESCEPDLTTCNSFCLLYRGTYSYNNYFSSSSSSFRVADTNKTRSLSSDTSTENNLGINRNNIRYFVTDDNLKTQLTDKGFFITKSYTDAKEPISLELLKANPATPDNVKNTIPADINPEGCRATGAPTIEIVNRNGKAFSATTAAEIETNSSKYTKKAAQFTKYLDQLKQIDATTITDLNTSLRLANVLATVANTDAARATEITKINSILSSFRAYLKFAVSAGLEPEDNYDVLLINNCKSGFFEGIDLSKFHVNSRASNVNSSDSLTALTCDCANFKNAIFDSANLIANNKGASFMGANLQKASFKGAAVDGVQFDGFIIDGLPGLSSVVVKLTNLQGANFSKPPAPRSASSSYTSISNANFSGANLTSADLSSTTFYKTTDKLNVFEYMYPTFSNTIVTSLRITGGDPTTTTHDNLLIDKINDCINTNPNACYAGIDQGILGGKTQIPKIPVKQQKQQPGNGRGGAFN